MIIIKLQGGLGNQLFQWAFSEYMKSIGFDVYLDISFYDVQDKRINELDNLGIEYKIRNKEGHMIQDDFIYRDYSGLNKNETYYFEGYWQSEKYFYGIKDYIIDKVSKKDILDKLNNKYPDLRDSLSMHFRRTDYILYSDIHLVQPIDFYNNALEILKTKYNKIYIFSDDISWCKENIYYENIHFVENNSNIEDMLMMSQCKDNIIVNSSFSWWGSYLNTSKDKKTIAPKRWFGNNIQTKDLYINDWILI